MPEADARCAPDGRPVPGVAALLHTPQPASAGTARQITRAVRPSAALLVMSALLFVIGVNTTAINAALTALAGDLDIGAGELSWTVGIYLLAAAAFVVPAGRLGDLLGERLVIVLGLLIFAAGAVVMAAAGSGWVAILGRFGQGLGSAFLMPSSMAALRVAYPPERQGFALGVWGGVGAAAFAVGPLIGGVFTDLASWRWVWWATAGYTLVLLAAAMPTLRAMPKPVGRVHFDLAGTGLLAVSLFGGVLAIQQGPVWGWASVRVLAAAAVAVAGLAVLVVVESRLRAPLLHLRLLGNPALAAANLGTLVNAVFLIGFLYFFNLYAQPSVTLGYSAVTAALALIPYGACTFAASMLTGRLCDRFGDRWPIAAGLALMGVGGLLLARTGASTGYGEIWWASMILGIGVGITFSSPSAAGLRAVSGGQAGEASGIVNVVRYFAATLVVTLGAILYAHVGSAHLNQSLDAAGVPRIDDVHLDKVLTGAAQHLSATAQTLPPPDRAAFRTGAAEGLAGGFAAVMFALGVIALLSAVAWIVLFRRTARRVATPTA